jgi:hypothetical protein
MFVTLSYLQGFTQKPLEVQRNLHNLLFFKQPQTPKTNLYFGAHPLQKRASSKLSAILRAWNCIIVRRSSLHPEKTKSRFSRFTSSTFGFGDASTLR